MPPADRRVKLIDMAKLLAKIVALLTPKRRWAQFSLGSMFVVVTGLCIWLAIVVNRAHRQREAVAAIEALGGSVEYEEPDETPSEAFPKSFLRRWLPRDYFDEVRTVYPQITDAGLAQLQGLAGLERLWLSGTQVTDAGLAHLQGLTWLQSLELEGTQITDAGLAHLQGLTGLRSLDLTGTQVTDTGLAHLHRLTGLQVVSLHSTRVTDAGLAQLRQALPNCRINGP